MMELHYPRHNYTPSLIKPLAYVEFWFGYHINRFGKAPKSITILICESKVRSPVVSYTFMTTIRRSFWWRRLVWPRKALLSPFQNRIRRILRLHLGANFWLGGGSSPNATWINCTIILNNEFNRHGWTWIQLGLARVCTTHMHSGVQKEFFMVGFKSDLFESF